MLCQLSYSHHREEQSLVAWEKLVNAVRCRGRADNRQRVSETTLARALKWRFDSLNATKYLSGTALDLRTTEG